MCASLCCNHCRYQTKRLRSPCSSSDTTISTLGEPRSPPCLDQSDSPLEEMPIRPVIKKMGKTDELDEEIGLDADALVFEMDKDTNFELDNGTCLEGQALVDHLIQTNDVLNNKIKAYFRKCNDLEEDILEEKSKCYKKIQNMRVFYRDMIFYGNSRAATMLKLSLNK